MLGKLRRFFITLQELYVKEVESSSPDEDAIARLKAELLHCYCTIKWLHHSFTAPHEVGNAAYWDENRQPLVWSDVPKDVKPRNFASWFDEFHGGCQVKFLLKKCIYTHQCVCECVTSVCKEG